MSRLTRAKKTKNPGRKRDGGKYTSDYKPCELAERLAAYEDSGLEPEQVRVLLARTEMVNITLETAKRFFIYTSVTAMKMYESLAEAEAALNKATRS